MTLTTRLALAVCWRRDSGWPCDTPCPRCLTAGKAAGLAVAEWLEERFGGHSETAALLRGVCDE